ncbi:MAG: Dihydrolipoyl dehydrogenase [bacterium ADurb.Bin270]|nr:MAG: Dihydrolipoyl dehydrogenase [bacterium ADurb.Bin270]
MYDLAIIGAGPGGYVAAISAAKHGAKVLLIERENVGGVCLNRGCIPTKAYIASAHALHAIRKSFEFGIEVGGSPAINFAKARSRKDEVVSTLRGGIETLLKGNKIELIRGSAAFVDSGLKVGEREIDAKNIVIATGSDWIDLPGIKRDGEKIVTSDEALDWESLPKSIAIIGGGVIGCEFACMLSEMGVAVTIIEATASILPPVEAGISRLLTRSMKSLGIEILTSTFANSASVTASGVSISLSTGSSIEVEKVMVAVGRRPLTEGLSLASAGIETEGRGYVIVDENFMTTRKDCYAIGDVKGGFMLAHQASAEGEALSEYLFGGSERLRDIGPIPKPIFTYPEVASVGLTSEELKHDGIEFSTGRFPYAACGKALCDGETEGQILVHGDKNGKILGVHAFGEGATLIIAEAALAMKAGLPAKDMAQTVHSHPTISETLAEAAADVYGGAVHKMGRK